MATRNVLSFFFFGTAFAKGDSLPSSVDWDPALAVGIKETVAKGIIFGFCSEKLC